MAGWRSPSSSSRAEAGDVCCSAHRVGDGPRRRAALMSVLPDGALMQRAAAGLAAAAGCGGSRRVYGAGSSCSWAAGTTAATRCSPRPGWRVAGAAVIALTVVARLHEAGRAAARRSGVRDPRGRRDRRRGLLAAADLVLDGMVGIGGSGGCAPAAARLRRVVAGCAHARRRRAERGRRRYRRGARARPSGRRRTITFGTVKPGLLGAAGRARTSGTSSWSLSACRCPPADLEQLERGRRRRAAARPRAEQLEVHPRRRSASPPAATRYRARRCCAPAGRAAAARATCASPAPRIRPSWCASASLMSSPPRPRRATATRCWPPGGCRPGWSVPGSAPTTRAPPSCEAVLGADVPVLRRRRRADDRRRSTDGCATGGAGPGRRC